MRRPLIAALLASCLGSAAMAAMKDPVKRSARPSFP